MRIIKLDSTFEFKTDEELRDYFERALPGQRRGKFRLGKGRLAEGDLGRGEKLLFCWQGVIRYIALAESPVERNHDSLKKVYGLCLWIARKTIRRVNMRLSSLEKRVHRETSIRGTFRGRGWNKIQDARFEVRLWKYLQGGNAVTDDMLIAIEGTKVEVRLMRRRRSRPLRNKALELSHGTCCVCDVNYGVLLGGLGWRVLQVHHKKQMRSADEPRRTKLRDLAVVCANCHMLIHSDPESAVPVGALRRKLRKTKRNWR